MLCSNIFLMKRVWSVHPTGQEEHRRISLTYKVPAVCLCWEHTSPRQENTFSYVWPKLWFWPCGQERKKKIHRDMTPKEQRPEWLWELIPSLCFKCGIWQKLGRFTVSASHSLEVKPTTFVLFSGPFPFPANGPMFPTLLSGLDPPARILSGVSFLNPLLQQSASQKSALEKHSMGWPSRAYNHNYLCCVN